MQEKTTFTIKEASKKLGVSTPTLRWYCSQGLIPHVHRDRNGYRVFEPWQIDLLHVLLGMKQAGFRASEIRRYARLFRQGDATLPERQAMLTTRKRQLWLEIGERQKAIDFIERQEELNAQNEKNR